LLDKAASSLLIGFVALAAASGAGAGIFPYETRTEVLPNGLKVILVPMSSGGLAAYWSIVRTGARDEVEPGRTGFAHFFEHMMFRGTEKYPSDVRDELITGIGANTNAFTSDDLTGYYLEIASEDLDLVMELESDRFKNLSYLREMFETEAGAVYGEYRKNRSNPFFVLTEAARAAAFEKHTYGHTAMGYEEDIRRMPGLFDYSRSFFSRFYRPENVVLLIAGDFSVESTLATIREKYGDWQPGYVPPEVPEEPPQERERRLEVAYEGRSLPLVWVGYKTPAFDPADVRLAAAVLLAELAFGETSDIYKQLVLDQQLVEFIGTQPPLSRDPGLLSIFTRIKDPEKVDGVVAAIDETIAGFRSELPDPGRLAALKSRLRYQFLMNLDTPDQVARSLVRPIAITGGIEAVDVLYDTYERVTPEDVREAAGAFLDSRRRTVAVLRGAR
jgi:zinc protease